VRRVQLGLLGSGVVGGGLIDLIAKNHGLIGERCGLDLVIQRALVRDLNKPRPGNVQYTTDATQIVGAPDIDIVVEVMGGTTQAYDYIKTALQNGKHVVTANKALLAQRGNELFHLATALERCIGYEASVCAGLPVIGTLRQGLVGNDIESLYGIVNGTNNYILTQMAEKGTTLEQAIAEAQKLGFCEADPSMDIDGIDAAQKLVVLSELAFGTHVQLQDVSIEGIRHLEPADLQQASSLGFVIKHIAIARRVDNRLDLRVAPMLLHKQHPLAAVRNEFNAILVKADAVGEMILQGKGAGAMPTASAVLSDIVDVALRDAPVHLRKLIKAEHGASAEGRYYLRFPIVDEPGVIGDITTKIGGEGVSIYDARAVLEEGSSDGNVMILTHKCSQLALDRAIAAMQKQLRKAAVVLQILELR
jgi:homoserine dehydrogenase